MNDKTNETKRKTIDVASSNIKNQRISSGRNSLKKKTVELSFQTEISKDSRFSHAQIKKSRTFESRRKKTLFFFFFQFEKSNRNVEKSLRDARKKIRRNLFGTSAKGNSDRRFERGKTVRRKKSKEKSFCFFFVFFFQKIFFESRQSLVDK